MQKKEIFSKLRIKDYNNELEEILEKKAFSSDAKNLLLSMLYKIETSYGDYEKVKQEVPEKQEYIEKLLEIIKTKCDKLEISKSAEFIKNKKSEVILDKKKIITYQSELELLKALYKMDNFQFNVSSTYILEQNSLPYVLKNADILNKTEVIKNFDGWSWNITKEKATEAYLVYQNLIILLGRDFFSQWENNSTEKDYMLILNKLLKEKYKQGLGNKIYELICQCCILIYEKEDYNEIERIEQNLELLKIELEQMQNKEKYLENLLNKKQICKNQIKDIDKKLNNMKLLNKEFEERNSNKQNEIFSLSDLVELMQKEREEKINEINNCNRLMQPKVYIEFKEGLKSKIQFIEQLDNLEDRTILLQKHFIKAIYENIKKAETKNEIIKLIYILRYYKFIPVTKTNTIIEIEILKKDIKKVEKELITKACNLKVLNPISKNEETNFKIISEILTTKSIDLEEIEIEYKNNTIDVYEENSVKKSINVSKYKEKINIKPKKKIKIFI